MRRLLVLVLGCAFSLSAMSAAHAQTPAPAYPKDIRAAAIAVSKYVSDLPDPYFSVSSDIKYMLNRPLTERRGWVERDRGEVAKAKESLAALKKPEGKARDFDMSFAVERVRLGIEANLANATKGADALEGMIKAQQDGDCAAYAAQASTFEAANATLRAGAPRADARALQSFLARFASGEPAKAYPAVAPAPRTHELRMKQLADDLAVVLRCPSPRTAFDIEVKVPQLQGAAARGPIYAEVRVVSSLEASQRAAIDQRYLNFLVPEAQRFVNWTEAAGPLKFRWDDEVLSPVMD